MKSGKRRERYLVKWDHYVVREHPTGNINIEVSSYHFQDDQARRRDLNNIYTFNTFIAYICLLYYLVSLDAFLRTIAIGPSIVTCLPN